MGECVKGGTGSPTKAPTAAPTVVPTTLAPTAVPTAAPTTTTPTTAAPTAAPTTTTPTTPPPRCQPLDGGTGCSGCADQSCCDKYYVPTGNDRFNCIWIGSVCSKSSSACTDAVANLRQ